MLVDAAAFGNAMPFVKCAAAEAFDKMMTLRNVATEMALHVLAYNIKRVIAILGVQELLRAI
jgi:hypothetical protein